MKTSTQKTKKQNEHVILSIVLADKYSKAIIKKYKLLKKFPEMKSMEVGERFDFICDHHPYSRELTRLIFSELFWIVCERKEKIKSKTK